MRDLTRIAVVIGLIVAARTASAQARLVAEPSSQKPVLGSSQEVLFIRRSDVHIGCPDAAPAWPDAAPPAPDAAAAPDAGGGLPDAAMTDAAPPDAGPDCLGDPVSAITMVVQPRFAVSGGGARFAVLLVTPANPLVETEDHELFATLSQLTAPDIQVHEIRVEDPALGTQCGSDAGCSFDFGDPGPSWDPPPVDGTGTPAIETVGPYEVARAQPADPDALRAWLDSLGYAYLNEDVAAVAPYLTVGYTVLAVRIDADTVLDGGLEPLALTWAGNQIRVPVGLAVGGEQPSQALTVYIAAEGRYDLPDADVGFAEYTSWGTARFLTRNDVVIDLTQPVVADPIAARVLGDPTYQATIVVPQMVRVPVSDCGDIGCCGVARRSTPPVGFLVLVGAVVAITRRRRRR